jgi:hypothetical protein
MAILKGFPLTNTIGPTTIISDIDIVETKEMIGLLNAGDKFKTTDECEFCVIHRKDLRPKWAHGVLAICYKPNAHHAIGNICCFDHLQEVIWLREVYRS